jgi:hypothetical protein
MATRKNNPTQYIARIATLSPMFWITVIILQFYNINARHEQIRGFNKETAEERAKSKLLEDQLLEFMRRSVQRWDALQFGNPNLNVPRAMEPFPPGAPELSPSDLQRNIFERPPKPTTSPTPRIVTKTKTQVRYRKAPTPKPAFHW